MMVNTVIIFKYHNISGINRYNIYYLSIYLLVKDLSW